MAAERVLSAGQEWTLAVTPGAEIFCAVGAVRVSFAGLAWTLPPQVLRAGQSVRCGDAGPVLVRALLPSRCRFSAAPAAASTEFPKANSLRPGGRRLLAGG